MKSLKLLLAASGLGLVVVASQACGGKVVVDSPSSTGSGGAGGASTSTTSGVFDGAGGSTGDVIPACGFPAPVGNLFDCGASATSGGGVIECDTSRCDDSKNIYAAHCTGASCVCTFEPSDGSPPVTCTCTLPDSCEVAGKDCCPVHQ